MNCGKYPVLLGDVYSSSRLPSLPPAAVQVIGIPLSASNITMVTWAPGGSGLASVYCLGRLAGQPPRIEFESTSSLGKVIIVFIGFCFVLF